MGRTLPLAVAVLAVVTLVGFGRSQDAPMPALRCARAMMIDGGLRCDDDAPPLLGSLCGQTHPAAATALAAGDAIETQVLCSVVNPRRGGPGWARMAPSDLRALEQPVDINEADADELGSLPGVGPKIAARIIEARPHADVESLLVVRGIGPKTLARLRPRVRVGSPAH